MATPDRARLRWQCRRGMLELDDLFTRFLEQGYDQLTASDQMDFEHLLTEADPLLFAWLMGKSEPEDEAMRRMIALICSTSPR